jgi:hypothetical protein
MVTKQEFDVLQGSVAYQAKMLISAISDLKAGGTIKGFPADWINSLSKLIGQLEWQRKQPKLDMQILEYIVPEIDVIKKILGLLKQKFDYTVYEEIETLCDTLAAVALQTRGISKQAFAKAA